MPFIQFSNTKFQRGGVFVIIFIAFSLSNTSHDYYNNSNNDSQVSLVHEEVVLHTAEPLHQLLLLEQHLDDHDEDDDEEGEHATLTTVTTTATITIAPVSRNEYKTRAQSSGC